MCTNFDQPAIINNSDTMGIYDGRKTMCNYENSFISHQIIKGFLHNFFRLIV